LCWVILGESILWSYILDKVCSEERSFIAKELKNWACQRSDFGMLSISDNNDEHNHRYWVIYCVSSLCEVYNAKRISVLDQFVHFLWIRSCYYVLNVLELNSVCNSNHWRQWYLPLLICHCFDFLLGKFWFSEAVCYCRRYVLELKLQEYA